MKRTLPIAFVFTCLVTTRAHAVDIDAPYRQTPTIRSEIQRGEEVASACSSGTNMMNATMYAACLTSASQMQARQATGTDAFFVGFYRKASAASEIIAGNTDRSDLAISAGRANVDSFFRYLGKVGISESDVDQCLPGAMTKELFNKAKRRFASKKAKPRDSNRGD